MLLRGSRSGHNVTGEWRDPPRERWIFDSDASAKDARLSCVNFLTLFHASCGVELSAKSGLQGSCNKVREKRLQRGCREVTTCGRKVVPELRFAWYAKNEGGGNEVTEQRPFFGGQTNSPKKIEQSMFSFFFLKKKKNLSHIVAVMTAFLHHIRSLLGGAHPAPRSQSPRHQKSVRNIQHSTRQDTNTACT